MADPRALTNVASDGPAPSAAGPLDPGVVFREDDESFKVRLKHNLMNHWLINTIATLVLFALVFWLLTDNWLTGILAGVLVLLVSNLYNVLWRIQDFERWEVFSNGVKLGYDPKGELKFIRFSEIEDVRLSKGPFGEMVVIDLGKRRLKYKYGDQREVFELIRERFEAFQAIQRTPPETTK